ncbi:hypothetical protein BJ912DRAFT_927551 [Pholiota molesta]|nr:hypothetical protein BJ912DRAFT_927551 [Pholiota molesta]
MSASVGSKSDSVQQNLSSPPSVFLRQPLSHSGVDIYEYTRLLKEKAVITPDGRVELSKCMITKLRHMKFTGAQHEYVVATVKYNDTEVHLSVERTKAAELPDYQPKKSPIKTPNCKQITEYLIPTSSKDALFKPTSATDMVKNIGHLASLEPSRVLMTFSPHPGILNLLQLAVIIEAVHDLEERYALDRAQCYWFAMLIMGAAMTRGGQVRYFERGRGKAETVQELPTVASTSDLSHIPISPPPPDEKGELVKAPDLSHVAISPPPPDKKGESVQAPDLEGGVGKYHWGRAAAVSPKDIRIIAVEAEMRYAYALVELETTFGDAAKREEETRKERIRALEEDGKKKDEELRKKDEKKDEEFKKKDEELRKIDEALRRKDELIRHLLSQHPLLLTEKVPD